MPSDVAYDLRLRNHTGLQDDGSNYNFENLGYGDTVPILDKGTTFCYNMNLNFSYRGRRAVGNQ